MTLADPIGTYEASMKANTDTDGITPIVLQYATSPMVYEYGNNSITCGFACLVLLHYRSYGMDRVSYIAWYAPIRVWV